jgi:superfamily I DNA/RNA helicase
MEPDGDGKFLWSASLMMENEFTPLHVLASPRLLAASGSHNIDSRWSENGLDLNFGYCITCHKAQGSEYDSVMIIDEPEFYGVPRYRWLYTACTRAKRHLTIVTRPNRQSQMQRMAAAFYPGR